MLKSFAGFAQRFSIKILLKILNKNGKLKAKYENII